MDIPKALLTARIRNYLTRAAVQNVSNIDIEHLAKEVLVGFDVREQAIIEQARSTPWTGTAPADLVGVIKQYMQEVSARESIRGEGFSATELGARIMEAGVRQQVKAYQGNEGQGSEAPIKPDTLPRTVVNFIAVAYAALRMKVPADIAEDVETHLMVILTNLRLRVEVGERPPLKSTTVPIEIALPEDARFLRWIYDRLVFVHKENMNVDYMLRLRGIIDALPRDAKYGRNDQIPDGKIVEPPAPSPDYPMNYLDTFIRTALAEVGHGNVPVVPSQRGEQLRLILVELHDLRAAVMTTQQERDQYKNKVEIRERANLTLATNLAEAGCRSRSSRPLS